MSRTAWLTRHDEGVAATWVAVFLALVLGPILALGIEIGRYAEARTLIQSAADLAALAATQEADLTTFQATGEWVLRPTAQGVAQRYVISNLRAATSMRLSATVNQIEAVGNTVRVYTSADVSELFPRFAGHVTINVIGEAQFKIH